ncbi:MAG TPA: hypothetical protein VMJ64_00835 [Anaerolineales bacterium]|nr:hypothetical protein [Anaerolineales bacterium]
MIRVYRPTLFAILIVTTLACGVISSPLSGVQSVAQTAQALASAIPSQLPDVSKYLNPQGTPVSEWNGIPVMDQATAGEEFSKNVYSYRVSGADEQTIQSFYSDKLKAAGWESPFSAQGASAGGLMLFTKDSQVLSITIAKVDQDSVVLLTLQ